MGDEPILSGLQTLIASDLKGVPAVLSKSAQDFSMNT